jgi:methyltransferase (TIGR00027 family)
MDPFVLGLRWSGYRWSYTLYPPPLPSTVVTMVPRRTWFFDQALAEHLDPERSDPVEQVVVLGAGWDTRCYPGPAREGVRCFEVDAPATQRAKRQALDRAGIDSAHVRFVAADFNRQSWLEAVLAHGFDPGLPTFVLWEGVSMYLEQGAIKATLQGVASLPAGSAVAFDYLSRELVECREPFVRVGRSMARSMKWTYGERWTFGLSTKAPARDSVEGFLAAQGLELRRYEPLGEESASSTPLGGLVVAGRRS